MPLIKNDESRPAGKSSCYQVLSDLSLILWDYRVKTNSCKLIFKCPYKIHSYADVHIQTHRHKQNKQIL